MSEGMGVLGGALDTWVTLKHLWTTLGHLGSQGKNTWGTQIPGHQKGTLETL